MNISAYIIPGLTKRRSLINNKANIRASVVKCCEFLDTTIEEMECKTRTRELVQKRMMIAQYLFDHKSQNLVAIGKLLNRDHTSIIHYQKTIKELMYAYPEIRVQYNELCNSIQS